jgi:hypothetical protein
MPINQKAEKLLLKIPREQGMALIDEGSLYLVQLMIWAIETTPTWASEETLLYLLDRMERKLSPMKLMEALTLNEDRLTTVRLMGTPKEAAEALLETWMNHLVDQGTITPPNSGNGE